MNALQSHRFLMRLALSTVNLFAWIFVFQFFFVRSSNLAHALLQTLFLYTVSQVVILCVTPFSASRLRNSIRRPMMGGVIFAAMAYASLAFSFSGVLGTAIFLGVIFFALLRGLYHALYWVPYQVESFTRGGQNTLVRSVLEVAIALMPALGGMILTTGVPGLNFIFYGAAILMLLSLIPLYRVPDAHEGYLWGYMETFKNVFAPRYYRLVRIAFLDGISGAALLLFWPIAIFLLVGWSYSMLGIVMTITYLFVFFTRAKIRSLLQRARIDESALVHVFLTMSGWLLRLVVATPLGVVLVDSYFYTGTHVRGTGVNMLTFEQSADGGSYIDEYTTLKEMALALGKITISLFGVLLAATISLPMTLIGVFFVAAIASGVSVFLTHQRNNF